MTKKIYLFTSSFPYFPGEQFIESEVKYLSTKNDIDITIFPLNTSSRCRKLPENIKINNSLSRIKPFLERAKFLILSLFSKNLYSLAYRDNALNRKLPFTILSYSRFLYYQSKIKKYIGQIDSSIILYTYWHNEFSYALQNISKKNKIVSRVHGCDIYENQKILNYMPLKRSFTKNIEIHALTESAKQYLTKQYGFVQKDICVSRLGVIDRNICCLPSEKKYDLHITSCSFLVKVKRVDKIIDALYELITKKPNLNIKWTHIGPGILQDDLMIYAKKLSDLISYTFIGELKNDEVFDFYRSNTIDLFINTSESEGVPVSIMEAMSCHVPVIAPDVGGISDIVVNTYNGVLLSSEPSAHEIYSSINSNINFFKSKITRQNARNTFLEKFNADKNYEQFYNNL